MVELVTRLLLALVEGVEAVGGMGNLPSLAISLLALAVSIAGLRLSWKKLFLDRQHYVDEERRRSGRSISLDVLRAVCVGNEVQTSDYPWDRYELKAVIVGIAFCNLSYRPVFVKSLTTWLTIESTSGYLPDPISDRFPMLDRLYAKLLSFLMLGFHPFKHRFGIRMPFRFLVYDPSVIPLIISRLRLPVFTEFFKHSFSMPDRFLHAVWVYDSESDRRVPQTGWPEIPPEGRKVWDIIIPIKEQGSMYMRKWRYDLSSVDVSLEFDTCSVEVRYKIPYHYWVDLEDLGEMREMLSGQSRGGMD